MKNWLDATTYTGWVHLPYLNSVTVKVNHIYKMPSWQHPYKYLTKELNTVAQSNWHIKLITVSYIPFEIILKLFLTIWRHQDLIGTLVWALWAGSRTHWKPWGSKLRLSLPAQGPHSCAPAHTGWINVILLIVKFNKIFTFWNIESITRWDARNSPPKKKRPSPPYGIDSSTLLPEKEFQEASAHLLDTKEPG